MPADARGNGRDTDFWIDLNKGESPIRVWDKLTLGGITWPGICKLDVGVSLEIEVAKFQTALAQGPNPPKFAIGLLDKGYKPGNITATVEIWTLDQWEDLKETLPKFSPRSGQKAAPFGGTPDNPRANRSRQAVMGRDAFDISHPTAALLAIDSVLVTDIKCPPIMDQTLTCIITMIQYFPQAGKRRLHSSGGGLNASDFDVPDVDPSKNV